MIVPTSHLITFFWLTFHIYTFVIHRNFLIAKKCYTCCKKNFCSASFLSQTILTEVVDVIALRLSHYSLAFSSRLLLNQGHKSVGGLLLSDHLKLFVKNSNKAMCFSVKINNINCFVLMCYVLFLSTFFLMRNFLYEGIQLRIYDVLFIIPNEISKRHFLENCPHSN